MFTEIFSQLEQGKLPDLSLLRRRFDLAMTKKLGVVKLPPAFWMQDSKINPRSDHLLQAALLLGDRERCDLALSVLAVEIAEKTPDLSLDQAARGITASLAAILPAGQRQSVLALADRIRQGPEPETRNF